MGLFDIFKKKEIVKALPPPPAKTPEAQSAQYSVGDLTNGYMAQDAGYGSSADAEPSRGLNYDQLLAMSRVPLISAIVQTRVNQIAEFSTPSRDGQDIGFMIRLKDRNETPDEEQLETMDELYDFMVSCGDDRINFETNFEAFLRMLVRDSLIYDQACFEVIKTRGGQVAGFMNVDSSTIRRTKRTKEELKEGRRDTKRAQFVQVLKNKTIAEFQSDELCFGIRRPRSDIRYYGYGFPELEECVGLITNLLNSDMYNASNFTNGISASGIIAVRSKMQPQLFRSFRREFYNMLSGPASAKKTPLIQLDPDSNEDVRSINLGATNKDMEYSEWKNYMIKSICAVFQVDPMEVGFKFGNENQKSSFSQESSREKILMSKEKGLRPLLRAIQSWLNKYVVSKLDDRFEIVFTGLDSSPPEQQLKLAIQKVKTFMTVNEIRALYDLEPIETGDIILDPTYLKTLAGTPATVKEEEEDLEEETLEEETLEEETLEEEPIEEEEEPIEEEITDEDI
tara:strand:- start:24412 stop:25941 length:1530 start_codon:yes stop_codon:yes gene_type:complete